jgi:hypothetical protein
MARLNKNQFNSEAVQGKGSFVIFNKPSFLESRKYVRNLRDHVAEIRGLSNDIPIEKEHIEERSKAIENEEDELVIALLSEAKNLFVDWNWTDGVGNKLPPLPELEDFENTLTVDEVNFILDCVRATHKIGDASTGKSVA